MGKTSNESKAKYNAKAYDRLYIVVPKGTKQAIADKHESINGYINKLIADDMGKEEK